MLLAIHTGSSQQIFDLVVQAEKHKKIVWTAGRVPREAAGRRVMELDYDERKIVLKGVTGILDEFALKGHLLRHNEPESIGYGSDSSRNSREMRLRNQPSAH
jgi:hypothetical protein